MSKKNIFIYILMGVTAVLIIFTAVTNRQESIPDWQEILQIMPLFVSIIIGMLQSKVSRFASLLGSINSVFYAFVYFLFNIYGSAFSALFFSCPIQILTFIRWNKHKRGGSTELRRMTAKQRILLSLGFIAALVTMWFVLPLLGSEYVFLDSVTTLLGIVIYFMTMFAYVEYTALMLINGAIGIALYIQMLGKTPGIETHLIFSVYSLICIIFAFFEAKKLYKIQQSEKEILQ